jgi:hypothetical protein
MTEKDNQILINLIFKMGKINASNNLFVCSSLEISQIKLISKYNEKYINNYIYDFNIKLNFLLETNGE